MALELFAIVVYAIEGLIIVPLNALLSISILFNKSLRQRKELVFIVGLSVSDVLYGIGCIEYGRDQFFNSYLSNDSLLPTTPFRCFLKPSSSILSYSYQVSMLIMCSISVERLIAVVSFQKYRRIRYRSHVFVLIGAYFLPLVVVLSMGYEAYLSTTKGVTFPNGCLSYSFIKDQILPTLMLALGISNVLLYGIVLIAYKTRMPAVHSSNSQQTIRNRRLTQTLALVTGCMLLFYCVPLILALILSEYSVYKFHLLIYLSMPLQYIAHVLVFLWRQKDIRQSAKGLLCCIKSKNNISVVPRNLSTNSAAVRASGQTR